MSTQYSDTVKVRQTVSSRQWLSDPAGDDKLYTRPRHSVEILVENREPAFCLVENDFRFLIEIPIPYTGTHYLYPIWFTRRQWRRPSPTGGPARPRPPAGESNRGKRDETRTALCCVGHFYRRVSACEIKIECACGMAACSYDLAPRAGPRLQLRTDTGTR